MPKKAECRVCGKSFIPCGKGADQIGAFNWMEVACSPECGQIYLERVIESRKPKQEKRNRKSRIVLDPIEVPETVDAPAEVSDAFESEQVEIEE